MFKWSRQKSRSEKDQAQIDLIQASVALNDAYIRYNHAEGYNSVKAAIYEIRAAELRVEAALRRAKIENKRRNESSNNQRHDK